MLSSPVENNIVLNSIQPPLKLEPFEPAKSQEEKKLTGNEMRIQSLKEKYYERKNRHHKAAKQLRLAQNENADKIRIYFEAEKDLKLAEEKFKKAKKEQKQAFTVLCKAENEVLYTVHLRKDTYNRYKAALNETQMTLEIDMLKKKETIQQKKDIAINVLNLDTLSANMPEEIMKHIASYITYDVRIQMITHFHKPMHSLQIMDAVIVGNLLYKAYDDSSLIIKQSIDPSTSRGAIMTVDTSIYNALHSYRKKEAIIKVKYMFSIIKQLDPEYSLRILKVLAVLEKIRQHRTPARLPIGSMSFKLTQDSEFEWADKLKLGRAY
jgi:hypothetical protein